jgi:hypothetical protein
MTILKRRECLCILFIYVFLQREDGQVCLIKKHSGRKYVAGTIDGPASNVKVKPVADDEDTYIFAITASVGPDGEVFNPQKEPTKHTTGKVYDSLFVRHWVCEDCDGQGAEMHNMCGSLTNLGCVGHVEP